MVVTLEEKSHTYSNEEGKTYTSVTTFVKKHFPEFQLKEMSKRVAKRRRQDGEKNSKGKPITAWDVRKEWEEKRISSSSAGSLTHYEIEEYIKGNIDSCVVDVFTPKAKQAIKWFYKSPLADKDIAPEVIIYDDELGLAGTIDLLCVDGENVVLADWKTSKKITKRGYGKGIASLPNANYYHYQLQLSTYAYLLERQGKKIKNLLLVHLLDDDVVVYEMDYNREVVETMLFGVDIYDEDSDSYVKEAVLKNK